MSRVPYDTSGRPPIPEDRPTRISVDRYISAEWMERERERLWPKVWQFACSLDHVSGPGDVFEFRSGWDSVIIVRGRDGELRAFQNACRHRGNMICQGTARGLGELRCQYHRWAWNTEGQITEVPSRKWFGALGPEDLALYPVAVDTWGPTVWINLDTEAMPLQEWLEGIPADIAWAGIDDYRCNSLVVRSLPANWKVVSEGFSETYHVQGVHPEMMRYVDDVGARQRLWHRHGVSYQDYGVPSPRLGPSITDEEVWRAWLTSFAGRVGLDPSVEHPLPEIPRGETLQDVLARMIVDTQASRGVDVRHFDTKRLTGTSQYNFFPNATMLVWSDMINVMATRPGPTPDECELVVCSFHRVAPGAARTTPITLDPCPPEVPLGLVIGQDVSIMQTTQRGLHQRGMREAIVSVEEARLINLHRNLDEWCLDQEDTAP